MAQNAEVRPSTSGKSDTSSGNPKSSGTPTPSGSPMASSSSRDAFGSFDPIHDILGEDWREMTDAERVFDGKPTESEVRQLLKRFNMNLYYEQLDDELLPFNKSKHGCQIYQAFQTLKKDSKVLIEDWSAPDKAKPRVAQKRKSEVLSSDKENKVTQ